jgi:peptidoglycan hydrolase CwlO-like protein
MGLGGTAKKLQKVAEMGEELYRRLNELRTQVAEMRETVDATHERVDRLENEVAEQRVILEALAAEEGLDVEALVAEAHISEAETDTAATESDSESEGTAGSDGATPGDEGTESHADRAARSGDESGA